MKLIQYMLFLDITKNDIYCIFFIKIAPYQVKKNKKIQQETYKNEKTVIQ